MKGTFNVMNFALACGITFGLGMFIFALMAMKGFGTEMMPLIQSVYKGTDATFMGAIAAGLWGFLDAFIGGGIFAFVYNWLQKNCNCSSKKKK